MRVKQGFVETFNSMINDCDRIIGFIEDTVIKLLDTKAIDKRIAAAKADADAKLKTASGYMELNSRTAIKQDEYNKKFDRLMDIYNEAKERHDKLERERMELLNRSKRCMDFIKTLREADILKDFDEELFCGIVEKITVYADRYVFEFKDGSTVEHRIK